MWLFTVYTGQPSVCAVGWIEGQLLQWSLLKPRRDYGDLWIQQILLWVRLSQLVLLISNFNSSTEFFFTNFYDCVFYPMNRLYPFYCVKSYLPVCVKHCNFTENVLCWAMLRHVWKINNNSWLQSLRWWKIHEVVFRHKKIN